MWYHGQDTAWGEEGEGVMDIGTGRWAWREEGGEGGESALLPLQQTFHPGS